VSELANGYVGLMRLSVEIVNPKSGEHRILTVDDATTETFLWTPFMVQALAGIERPDPDMVEPLG
jgi:hypothetical protein